MSQMGVFQAPSVKGCPLTLSPHLRIRVCSSLHSCRGAEDRLSQYVPATGVSGRSKLLYRGRTCSITPSSAAEPIRRTTRSIDGVGLQRICARRIHPCTCGQSDRCEDPALCPGGEKKLR